MAQAQATPAAVPVKRTRSKKAGTIMLVACLVMAVMAVLLVPTLVSGSTPLNPISQAAMAAPKSTSVAYSSLEEAQAALQMQANFPLSVPEGTTLAAIRVVDASILELEYHVGKATVLFRTAQGNDDISGVSKEYAYTSTEEVGGVTRGYAGVTEDILNMAVWASGDYSYAIVAEAGVSAAIMRQFAESVA